MARDRDAAEESNESILGRRTYLKLTGAAAASTVATNAAGRASAAKQSGDAVNIVDEGADSNGSEPIDSVLNEVVSDGATIKFPAGTYKINSFSTSANDVTFRGKDAKLCPAGSPGSMLKFSGNNWTFDGFTLDATQQPSATPKSWLVTTGQGWEVKNVTAKGKLTGGKRFFLPYVPNGDGKGVFKNITATDGSEHDTAGCYYVHKPHKGTLVLDNVDIRNFGSRGIYHSGAAPGSTQIINSYWENNRVNVRFGGRNCKLKNTTIKQTVNKRGPDYCVWLRANKKRPQGNVHAEAYGAVIENCDLVVNGTQSNETPDQASAISVGGGSNGYFGSFEVRDTRIRVKGANASAGISANGHTQPEGISGSVPKTKGTIKNVSITTDQGVDGVAMERDGKVTGSCISTEGQALNFQGVNVNTANINTSGSCPLPSLKSNGGSNSASGKSSGSSGNSSSSSSSESSSKQSSGSSESSSESSGSMSKSSDSETSGSDDKSAKDGKLSKTLVVDGTGHSQQSSYAFTVDGNVEKAESVGVVSDEDTISDGRVEGAVDGAKDGYRFSGNITQFRLNGTATVRFESDE